MKIPGDGALTHLPHALLELSGVEEHVQSAAARDSSLSGMKVTRSGFAVRANRIISWLGVITRLSSTPRTPQKPHVPLLDVAPIAPELNVDRGSSRLLRQKRANTGSGPSSSGTPGERHGIRVTPSSITASLRSRPWRILDALRQGLDLRPLGPLHHDAQQGSVPE
jgi:hypothetical protein